MKKLVLSIAVLAFVFCGTPALAEDGSEEKAASTVKLEDDADRLSYSIGVQVGRSLNQFKDSIKVEVVMAAVQDILAGRETAMSTEEVQTVMRDFQTKMREEQVKKQQGDMEKNAIEGAAFLEENKSKDGISVTNSGLQYKVLTPGDGKSPGSGDKVKVHYRGTLLDGTQFDSSYDRGTPAEFQVTQVIAGWTEALQLMKVGAKWQLFIPSELAYGERGRPSIPANSVLIFEVELIEVVETGEVVLQ